MSKTTEITNVELGKIVPSKTNPRSEFDQIDIKELAASMDQQGLLQAIIVRPLNGNGSYELVAGERRLRAAKHLKWQTIPSSVRTLNDDEAFDMQITENLQRKDVHPLDEADAYKKLIDRGATKDQLATRFGKPATYIVHRLKLNDLTPDFKKEFYAGKLQLGHALLLCRLTQEQQKEAKQNMWEYTGGADKEYKSVKNLHYYIERNIIQNLSAVAFKKDDATLVPAAGPCTTCPKRSGANAELFPDIKQQDRCFDKKCFENKSTVYIEREARRIIDEALDIHLLKTNNYQGGNKAVEEYAKQMKVPVLKQYNDFPGHTGSKEKHTPDRGFYIDGHEAGKLVFFKYKKPVPEKKTKGAKTAKAASPGDPVKDKIQSLKDATAEAIEVAKNNAYESLQVSFSKFIDTKKPGTKMSDADRVALIWFLIDMASYSVPGKMLKEFFGFSSLHTMKKENYETFYKAAAKLSDGKLAFLIQQSFMHQFDYTQQDDVEAYIIRKMAEQHAKDVGLDKIDTGLQLAIDKIKADHEKRNGALKEQLTKAKATAGDKGKKKK